MTNEDEKTVQENKKKMAQALAQLGDEVHLLTSLLEGGHLKPEEAYFKVKDLWRQVKHTKRDLFPDMHRDEQMGGAAAGDNDSSDGDDNDDD